MSWNGRGTQLVHVGSRGYGWLTARHRMLPRFLLCGGQRCGTTSMYRALAAHPAILKAVLHKGVHYFDVGYARGERWYRGHFPLWRTAEQVRRRYGVPAQAFESSPYYLYHPNAARRIAADLPDVRVVVLLRDPVERAYSQHAHEVARGFETEPDFGRALELEPDRLRGEAERMLADPGYASAAHRHHGYRARGEYVGYLESLAGALGRERTYIVDSAVFFADPRPSYDGVLRFLGLPTPPELGATYPAFDRHNARIRSTLDDGLRSSLAAHFAPYDRRLADWLGYPPSWLAPT